MKIKEKCQSRVGKLSLDLGKPDIRTFGTHQQNPPAPFAEHGDCLPRDDGVWFDPRGEGEKVGWCQTHETGGRESAAAVPGPRVVGTAPRGDFRIDAVEVHGRGTGSWGRCNRFRRGNALRLPKVNVLSAVPNLKPVVPARHDPRAKARRQGEHRDGSEILTPHDHGRAVRGDAEPAVDDIRVSRSDTRFGVKVIWDVFPLHAAVELRYIK